MTPARTDLPKVGDEIAVLCGFGQWYGGPYTVTGVDPARCVVTTRLQMNHMASYKARPKMAFIGGVVFDADGFRWNLFTELSEDERAPLLARQAEATALLGAGA